MKRVVMTWNIGKSSKQIRHLLVTGRMFALMSLGSMVLVLVIGIGAILQQRASSSPVSSMKGFAATVSSGLFMDMLSMEMPGTGQVRMESSFSGRQVSNFLVRLLTDVNPSDPKSLLAREYPGLGGDDAFLLRASSTVDSTIEPEDHEPLPIVGDQAAEGSDSPQDPAPDTKPVTDPNTQTDPAAKPTTSGRKVVFIYHSHSRESWFPELKSTKYAESSTKNITLIGKRLEEKLEARGMGALHSSTDYPSAIKNFNWVLSYKYSKKTVTSAISANKELKYFFDIHRDSAHRKNTTTTIKGKSYAQVFFIIGLANKNWKKNEAFANQIQAELDKQYPGISRGIHGKTTASGNGEYNQSIAPDSVLIEVGGVDNTLEESYRTVDVLAKVISELYWGDEKVIAPKSS
ncbi:stage II sporulation protein P [Paenibacillus baekrokdamisoli]|uniref:Stage II sporulation protein P n=1 Tax=Paenibacillus baekrokdamisoli TaxID=1712516 RepID=A0A3G9IYT5_9BACL|nr:stage II sporulation protein P [Paenibacillus baekrokdamisoli]MBB3070320.1 stage II sporulation protein P [Paenibacillus baekrokdamisoli]BBH21325.1 stage II sporulation protein P [Paenibacillus baekrokdamisoli]